MFKQTGGAPFDSWLIQQKDISPDQYAGLPDTTKAQLQAEFNAAGGASAVKSIYSAPAGAAGQAHISCTTERDCDRYGKDDIENELIRLGFAPTPQSNRTAGPNQFSVDSTKPELIQILLNHNKREMAKFAMMAKQSRMGVRAMHGAFPSEATNPSMYDTRSGLLKTQYLTQDHHGLTAFDYKGDKYQVFYKPKLNGWGGDAEWRKLTSGAGGLTTCDPMGVCRTLPTNLILDKRGLPVLSQLNYFLHYGLSYRGKDGKLYILVPTKRKIASNYSIDPSNAVADKNGNIPIQWALASSHNWTTTPVAKTPEDQKFFLPDGSVMSGKELSKLNVEQILRMHMLLELMEPANQASYAAKMQALGLGPWKKSDGPRPDGSAKRKRTLLPVQDRAVEEGKYINAGLPQCGAVDTATGNMTPAFRCYTDSYIPGACVPHEEICYNVDYKTHWMNSPRYGDNTNMQWAKDKMNTLEQVGALESENAYNTWKSQQDQLKAQNAMNQAWGARGASGSIDSTQIFAGPANPNAPPARPYAPVVGKAI